MKIGDLVRFRPTFAPACVGVIVRLAANPRARLEFGDFQICWSNGDSLSWVHTNEIEIINETR